MVALYFEIAKFLQHEASEIIADLEKAVFIDHTNDIDAAGVEVEQAVRKVLRRKHPTSYYLS
jgi:hypothetical protein